ncbi:MAG TPA: hypothetical protein VFV08_06425 [Puia sp.]|nr:hypothetical protein [Puia sp.]
MVLNIKRALICFIEAYILVTVLAVTTSVAYEMVAKPAPTPPGVSALQSPAFLATVPYHVAIMLVAWPLFAGIYFRRSANYSLEIKERWALATFWMFAAIVVDFVCFVLIKSPYSFTFYEFYIIYQPWISLIYLSIFLSPFIHLFLSSKKKAREDGKNDRRQSSTLL